MKQSRVFKVILVVVLIAGTVFWWRTRAAHRAEKARVGYGEVKRQDLVQRVTISGQIWPKKRLDVMSSFRGYVQKVFVKIGDHVKAKDPLVIFSPSLGEGENNFPVRATFAGVVTEVLKQEGDLAPETGEQSLAVRVEDITQFFVHATVPELDVAKVKVGQEALARVSALPGDNFKGEIEEISLSARDKDRYSSSSTEYQLKIVLKNHNPHLFPGMTAVLDIITSKKVGVLALSHEFVQSADGSYFVTMANGVKRPVTVGLQTDEAVEILTGLSEHDLVQPIDFLSLPKVED
jgi:membrane fusion protein (multidrug efflux system)